MHFIPTNIKDAWLIEPELLEDERGFFTRTVCKELFTNHGLNANFVQQSISHNIKAGTIRGMHWQGFPYEEEKLVRCTAGSIIDIIVDIRPTSPTFMHFYQVELKAYEYKQLYIPKGVAHGFRSLKDNTDVFYEMTHPYVSSHACGFKWDDELIANAWDIVDTPFISEKDKTLPCLKDIL